MHLRGWWSAAWPTRRSRALDVTLAVSFAVLDGLFLWFSPQHFWLPHTVTSACSVVLGLCIVVRRRYPVALAVFATAFSAVTGGGAFVVLVILYSLAAYATSRRVVL